MLQKNIFLKSGIFFFSLSLLIGCWDNKDKNIPDVSGVDIAVKVNRFDQELFSIDTNQVVEGIKKLEKKYPDFTDFYLTRALQIKKPWDTTGAYREYTRGFLTYPFVRTLHYKVDSIYGDFNTIKKELKQGLQFYKHYFPDKAIPEFYTIISEFTFGIGLPPKENSIAIGLDLFLGKDFEYYYYPPLSLPKYVGRTQDEKHLTAQIFEGMIDDMIGPVKGNRFIDHIIHNGKKIYLLDQLLPYAQDSIKLGYTAEQVDWVNNYEVDVWGYMLKEEMMYSNDFQSFKSLVTPAPKSTGMPDESPGEVGNWIGWQIVKAYMKRNPETTLKDLITLEDEQEILSKSRYKPTR